MRYALLLVAAALLAASTALAAQAAVTRVYGEFGGLWLVSYAGAPPAPARLVLGSAARPLLLATLPDPLVQKRLEALPVSLASSKTLEPVSTGWYRLAWVPRPPSLVNSRAVNESRPPLMLIVVPDGLEWFGEELARLHRGLRVVVMNWTSVLDRCGSPAPPPPGYVDPATLREKCGVSYNATKALCLIALERRLLREGLRYLLLVGPASATPPVYYYSPILEYVGIGRCQEYVPTDYWYADPLYEWKPVVAVGRIPFNDTYHLTVYLDALRSWMRWGRRGVVAAGGALFQTTLMLGESAVYEFSRLTSNAKILTLSLGGYKPLAVQPLAGHYALYYIVSHGIGDVLLDVFPRGLYNTRVDLVLAPKQLPSPNPAKPGVYVTPACLSAYWDDDVVKPPFHPPSVGVALLGEGYAVDYFGSSRIAVAAIVKLSASPGSGLDIEYLGALRLTELIASMMLSSGTVGEAVVKALAAYSSLARGVAIAYTPYGSEDVAVLTMLEFVLLGDPAAPAPRGGEGYHAPPKPSIAYNDTVPLIAVYPLGGALVEGSLPLIMLKPGEPLYAVLPACPDRAVVVTVARYHGLLLAGYSARDAVVTRTGGNCTLVAALPPGPSLHYIIAEYGSRVVRIPVLVASFNATPLPGGRLRVYASGVDLLRVTEDEPVAILVDGRIASWIPGGRDYINTTISVGAYGNVTVTLLPWRMYQGLAYGSEVSTRLEQLIHRWFTARVVEPGVRIYYQPRGVLVELVGYRLVGVEGAARTTMLSNATLLVCAEKPFTLRLAYHGETYSFTVPAAYTCSNTTAATTATQRATASPPMSRAAATAAGAEAGEAGQIGSTAAARAASSSAAAATPSQPPVSPYVIVAAAVAAISAAVSFIAVYAASERRGR